MNKLNLLSGQFMSVYNNSEDINRSYVVWVLLINALKVLLSPSKMPFAQKDWGNFR